MCVYTTINEKRGYKFERQKGVVYGRLGEGEQNGGSAIILKSKTDINLIIRRNPQM